MSDAVSVIQPTAPVLKAPKACNIITTTINKQTHSSNNSKSCCHCVCTVVGDFNKNLAALLVKIIIQRLSQWKLHAADNLGNETFEML